MRREYPTAPIAAVGVVVLTGGERSGLRVLLVKRQKEPSKGRWGLPGGAIELGERVREAAAREVREECGIEVSAGQVIEVLDAILPDEAGRTRFHYVLIDLLAEYVRGELTPSSDALDARWFTEEELAGIDVPEITVEVIREGMALRERKERQGEGVAVRLWQRGFWR